MQFSTIGKTSKFVSQVFCSSVRGERTLEYSNLLLLCIVDDMPDSLLATRVFNFCMIFSEKQPKQLFESKVVGSLLLRGNSIFLYEYLSDNRRGITCFCRGKENSGIC